MGFIETLVPEAPALIEKNVSKRMFIKSFIVIQISVYRAHPNICRRTGVKEGSQTTPLNYAFFNFFENQR